MASWFAAAASDWFATPATQLAEARAQAVADGEPDTCRVVGWLTVRNARGNTTNRAEVVRATGVPCRVQRDLRPVFGAESGGAFGRSGNVIDTSAQAYMIALPWGTDVRETDHLVTGSGAHYEVTSVDDESSYGVEIICGGVKLGLDQTEASE